MTEDNQIETGSKKSDIAFATGSEDPNSVPGLFEQYYLDYASYVILDRAIPAMEDGLKPVQRRILHAMQQMDDGRFNKVANIIGHSMQYHPHGDASIGDALVHLGQKELLIDTQGNWGNILTGDSAAAPRYIEARLTDFARQVVFQPDLTEWQPSYDGRNREPVRLPIKFPLLLAQGADGIAVGLATKILSHNVGELIDASVSVLRGEKFEIFPDFVTGGIGDFSEYNDGKRGGRVKLRASIKIVSNKLLAIKEIPPGTSTGALIESIVSASDKGKIKIKKVEDNTSSEVEILVHLPPGVDPQMTIDALYAFTDCQTAISTNGCVVLDGHPVFLGVSDLLRASTTRTKELLGRELEINRGKVKEKILFSSLERLFIEKRSIKS